MASHPEVMRSQLTMGQVSGKEFWKYLSTPAMTSAAASALKSLENWTMEPSTLLKEALHSS